MLRKIMGTATFTLGSMIALYYQHEELKRIKEKIADTPHARNELHYVFIHLVRGRYNHAQAIEMMRQDMKIYRTAIALKEIETD